jgi:hypothetical protein
MMTSTMARRGRDDAGIRRVPPAWSLETVWGTSGWHRARVAAAVLDGDARD